MNIYEKIAKVQDEIQNITKDSSNPHFGNTYATYEQVMAALHPVLRKYNLVVTHGFEKPLFEGQMAVTTRITDFKSEEPQTGVVSTLYLPVTKLDPQQAGSAITYAKRYMVLAMFGLGTEDDDGNVGSGRVSKTSAKPLISSENAIDDGLVNTCQLHGVEMIQRVSAKTGNPYWSHKMKNGDLCFGKEAR